MRTAPLQKGKGYVGSLVALREVAYGQKLTTGVGLAILTAKPVRETGQVGTLGTRVFGHSGSAGAVQIPRHSQAE